jgi:hypothetical protein
MAGCSQSVSRQSVGRSVRLGAYIYLLCLLTWVVLLHEANFSSHRPAYMSSLHSIIAAAVLFILGWSNLSAAFCSPSAAFVVTRCCQKSPFVGINSVLFISNNDKQDDGVVELVDDIVGEPVKKTIIAPFFSQGEELAEGVLNPDFSDPKQTRVILYIIISLVPVLFLIPLMIGSRDFLPPDALPPIEMMN